MPLFKASFISKIMLLLVSTILSISTMAVDFAQTQQLASKGDAKIVHKLYFGDKTVKDIFPDFVTAEDLYQKAAEQGNAEAQNMLGWHYYTIASYNEAIEWYQKAAEQGNAEAQYRLGEINQEGWGVKQSYAKAIDWYTKAANLGSGGAQFTLGLMYYDGEGVYKDIATAKDLLNKACDNDYPSACDEYVNLFLLQTE